MSVANRDMKVGDELPPLTKKVKLTVPPGGYPWGSPHNQEYAKSLGYKGAIVSGVLTLTYMSECLRRFFGKGWVKGGKVDVSFVGGVIDGETVVVKGIIKDKQMENSMIRLVLDVWMENEEGQKVVVGSASGLVS
jgi:acyl dehydratase